MTSQPNPSATRDESFLVVAKVLLLIQGSIVVASLLETLIAGAVQGTFIISTVGLSAIGASLTLWIAGRLHRRGRRVRKTALYLEYLWLTSAGIDLLLSVFLTQRLLEPVPLLTRFAIPIALIRLLRSPTARLLFNVPPTRRARRKAHKLMEAAV